MRKKQRASLRCLDSMAARSRLIFRREPNQCIVDAMRRHVRLCVLRSACGAGD